MIERYVKKLEKENKELQNIRKTAIEYVKQMSILSTEKESLLKILRGE